MIAILTMALAAQLSGSSPSKYAQADRIITAGLEGNLRSLSSIPFIGSDGRRVNRDAFVRYAKGCEMDQIQSRGSNLSASILCRVDRLSGIRVAGGARLLEGRNLTFVFGESRKLLRVVLGDSDPLAAEINVIPKDRR